MKDYNDDNYSKYSGTNAVNYLRDFILKSLKLSPEEEENAAKAAKIYKKKCRLSYETIGNTETIVFTNDYRRKIKNKINLIKNKNEELGTNIPDPFTAQEQEIANLLIKEKSYIEIAEILSIKMSTVKTHVSHIFQKTHSASVGEVIYKLTGKLTDKELKRKLKILKKKLI